MMRYTELAADESGETRFEDRAVDLAEQKYHADMPPVPLRVIAEADRVLVISFPAGLSATDFHPAPRHQWAVVLAGRLELGTTDGAERAFGIGSVVNVKDSDSRGHTTRVPGAEDVQLLVVEYRDKSP